jgi:hypothetical protein
MSAGNATNVYMNIDSPTKTHTQPETTLKS